ncbi:hypothetical protein [Corynebacterium sp. J010B-136]|uniref:hypothetical protein n=1 Tax=Corynebacterium sp. J010B-136 TaxID=2099401 RepID=UPI000CFA3F28|nr:hypothetical protein [Corynebacterium sp. J010B-136]PQM75527.1 hypothetical protein C5Y44_01825 [Corynebacterium sp. J010B-136]
MKKFKKFTAVAGAAAIMTAGALTAPVAGAAEDLEGTSSDIKASIEGLSSDDSIFSGSSNGDENTTDDKKSSSEEGNNELASSDKTESDKDKGSSENEQAILGVGIIATIIAGIANFWPQIQKFLP